MKPIKNIITVWWRFYHMALKEKIEKNRQEKHDEKYMKMALKEAKKA